LPPDWSRIVDIIYRMEMRARKRQEWLSYKRSTSSDFFRRETFAAKDSGGDFHLRPFDLLPPSWRFRDWDHSPKGSKMSSFNWRNHYDMRPFPTVKDPILIPWFDWDRLHKTEKGKFRIRRRMWTSIQLAIQIPVSGMQSQGRRTDEAKEFLVWNFLSSIKAECFGACMGRNASLAQQDKRKKKAKASRYNRTHFAHKQHISTFHEDAQKPLYYRSIS